jgi:xanthine dehydrogenase accessory factor
VLGTNEIASAVAVHLVGAGYAVVLSHDPFPPVIRRGMAFHDARFGDRAAVERIEGERAETGAELAGVLAKPRHVAVTPLHLTDLIAWRGAHVVVDARMQKHRITPDLRGIVRHTIGLGPNFIVGVNCDIAVETRPGKEGGVVVEGRTDAADGIAPPLGGVGKERLIYSDRDGRWHTPIEIGMRVFKGFVLGHLEGAVLRAPFDGVVRGIVRDATRVPAGVKLVELDRRGRKSQWTGMDARGRAIGKATVKAILLRAAERAVMEAMSAKGAQQESDA